MSAHRTGWYFAGVAAFFGPAGIQAVVLAYLLAIELNQPADRFGLTQMLGQLPLLLLLMVGGWLSDRIDARRVLITMQLLGVVLPLALAAALSLGSISEPLVLAYALAWGVVSAFAIPARDGMLNRIAGTRIQRVVTQATGFQFAAMMLGQALAGQAGSWGPVNILFVQSAVLVFGAWAALRLPSAAPVTDPAPRTSVVHQIASGFAVLFATPTIRAAFLLVAGMGVFFTGVMIVLVPLAIRDLYNGGAGDIAYGLIAFGLGMLTTIMVLIRRGGISMPGRALSLALVAGSLVLLPIAWDTPQWVFNLCLYAWGLCGGVAMSMSRTILQENAPSSHRSRVMASFSLATTGGTPIGSLLMGLAIGALGVRTAVLIPVAGVILTVIAVLATHPLWSVRTQPGR
jgi:MFS family permease